MVIISPESRLLQRLSFITPILILLIHAVDETPVGCLGLAFSQTLFCQEKEPLSYWLYLIFLVMAGLFSLYLFLQTYRKIEPQVLEAETRLLRRWVKGAMRKSGGTLDFPARSNVAALLIALLYAGPFLLLAIKHQTLSFPADFQLEFGAATLLGALLVWFPIRWFSESLTLTQEGIRYRNLLKPGRLRPWNAFKSITLKNDFRHSQGLWLRSGWFWSTIVVNQNTIPKHENFCQASRFILEQVLAQKVPIHIPVGGVADWIEICVKKEQ